MKVRVCVRTRPTQNFAQDNLMIDTEHATIKVKHVESPSEANAVLNNRQNAFSFKFDYVFHNASQSAVYDLYARDCVQGVVNGVNGSILSYGQTGSGKTFTMLGDAQSYEHRGIAPRAISQLFGEIASRVETEFFVSCTFMEIYNERIYDLLADLNNSGYTAEYTIAEDKEGKGVFVRGLVEIEVRDESAALSLLFSGGLSRTVASHRLNKRSNRSHSIFTLYVQQRQRSGVSEKVVHSKLYLIDLAGSERLKKTMESPEGGLGDEITRKESMAINQSLTFLEQCVVALSRKGGHAHVPFRQSKLTNIMKDSLGGNCATVMIACIWGESSHLEETISTLRLASRMMRVQNEASKVESIDNSILVKRQEKIINALKQELLMHDALVQRTGVVYDPYTPEQQSEVGQMIERYVAATERDEEGVLKIISYREMLEICRQFKKKLIDARSSSGSAATNNLSLSRGESFYEAGGERKGEGKGEEKGGELGGSLPESRGGGRLGFALESNKGFALGEARADNRPTGGIETPATFSFNRNANNPSSPSGGRSPSPPLTPNRRKKFNQSLTLEGLGGEDQEMLESFVKGDKEGGRLFNDFLSLRNKVKETKGKVRDLSLAVNEAKFSIDQLSALLASKKQAGAPGTAGKGVAGKGGKAGGEVVDEEEFRIAKGLKEERLRYRNTFEQMQKLQQSLESMIKEQHALRESLGKALEKWQRSRSSPLKFLDGGEGGDMSGMLEGEDELDDQEAFDRLEVQRVVSNDPDSLAFFTAQKTRRANLTQSGGTLRMLQKNKRYG